ncbi:hypothetical protein JQ604_01095 [Bradyrhizobium jicamae]|uniref:hypothetical protein n=1 Tax=Bradyrhizobium jicamae TaxID=280332 RepID=UPI001BA57A20|nr:hypothetical protein [Bradyrhizobium jicamae]MBR0750775.1 hypothetical protein [Bradyrhizobium jicamae]
MKQRKVRSPQDRVEEALRAANRSLRDEVVALMLDIAALRELTERLPASQPRCQADTIGRAPSRRMHG